MLIDDGVQIKNYYVRTAKAFLKPYEWKFIWLAILASISNRTSKKRFMRLVVIYDRLLYYKRNYNDSVILLEEGIVQYLSALAYENELVMSKSVEKIIDYFFSSFEAKVLLCNIPIDESMKRLEARGRVDLYTMENKQKQKTLLENKQKSIMAVLQRCPSPILEVDMNQSVDEIMSYMKTHWHELGIGCL